MRVRTKDCYVCNDAKEVLYRCRYQELKDWVFLCGRCLTDVKSSYEETYQYGGTWKSKKTQVLTLRWTDLGDCYGNKGMGAVRNYFVRHTLYDREDTKTVCCDDAKKRVIKN